MNEFKSMGEALQEMFQKNKSLQHNQEQFELQEIVKHILGEQLLQYIKDITIKEQNIIIRTDMSVLKHEIKLLEQSFIQRINEIARKNIVKKITVL
ncbi:MAG: DciA family protein [Chitinophagaceae bacterium]